MKIWILALAMLAAYSTAIAQNKLFHSLGLGFEGGERQGNCSHPRMHIEGDRLYICTCQGLYAKDLTAENCAWQLAGFEGIPLQDYARRGNDILALRYNEGGSFLLLSHDGGQTYEDVTPEIFRGKNHGKLPSLVQHPTDPNTLLVSSTYWGMLLSTDFGKTWECLTEFVYGNAAASFIGFHPSRPNIIYNSGESIIYEGHIIISYDNGQTWTDHGNSLGFPGDNCVHHCQNYWGDESRTAYWYFSAFDNEQPDTVYMAGCLGRNGQEGACIKLMCSTDGGRSWHPSHIMTFEKDFERVNDLQQYGDHLLIYSESDVYEISKDDLVRQSTTSIQSIRADKSQDGIIYDLQGRRVNQMSKGIFIKNGKKYFIK